MKLCQIAIESWICTPISSPRYSTRVPRSKGRAAKPLKDNNTARRNSYYSPIAGIAVSAGRPRPRPR